MSYSITVLIMSSSTNLPSFLSKPVLLSNNGARPFILQCLLISAKDYPNGSSPSSPLPSDALRRRPVWSAVRFCRHGRFSCDCWSAVSRRVLEKAADAGGVGGGSGEQGPPLRGPLWSRARSRLPAPRRCLPSVIRRLPRPEEQHRPEPYGGEDPRHRSGGGAAAPIDGGREYGEQPGESGERPDAQT